MKFFASIMSVLILTILLHLLFSQNRDNDIYHVVIVTYNVTHKPVLPSKKHNDFIIVVNQSNFSYKMDANHNEFEFVIPNLYLNKEDLTEISKELVPKDAIIKYYVF